MKFENKLLLLLFATLVIGFSVNNFLSVYYLQFTIESNIEREAKLFSKLVTYNKYEKVPEYIFISETPVPKEGYRIITYTGKHYVMVSNSYTEDILKKYAVSILLWESGTVILILMLFYYTTYKYLNKERETKQLLNILLLAITHKIGNFLATQKLNIELLRDSPQRDRLKQSVLNLEKTYQSTVDTLKAIQKGSDYSEECVNLRDLVLNVVDTHRGKAPVNTRINVSGDIEIKANRVYLTTLLDLLLENAIKYSDRSVYVRAVRCKRHIALIVRNDVASEHGEGTGMGLKIVNFIADRLGVELRVRKRKNFSVAVVF